MKKLCSLVLLLMVIALLCGCVASRASELPAPTVPVNQPAAPQLSLNAEPKPEPMLDDVHSMELSANLNMAFSGDSNVQEVIAIRTYGDYVQYFTPYFRANHPEYNYEFFKNHSIVYIWIRTMNSPIDLNYGELTRDDSGVYHMDLHFHWQQLLCPATDYASILLVLDHVIDSDARIIFHSTSDYDHLEFDPPVYTEPPQNEAPELLIP